MKPEALSPAFAPFVSSGEMRALEAAAVAAGSSEDTLMEEAGLGLAQVMESFFPSPGTAVVFAGKGHNAGDAFVLARHLVQRGWRVEVRMVFARDALKPLALAKLEGLGDSVAFAPVTSQTVPSARPLVLVDGLLGIGTAGRVRGPVKEAVDAINALRNREQAATLAIDLPSGLGLGGDTECVTADFTVTPGWPKEVLLAEQAAASAGRLIHVPLTDLALPEGVAGRDRLVSAAALRAALPARASFAKHKGQSGRVGIVAGSVGLTGAARLAATAASLMGGGLVTLFCPRDVYPILAAACPPEVMVKAVGSCLEVREHALDAIGIGPGLGPAPLPCLADLLFSDPRPVVVDADALNALAAGPWLARGGLDFSGHRLLTPHPGELRRLIQAWGPDLLEKTRREQAAAFTKQFPVTLLAKSGRSFVVETGRPALWNSTGHPLMARGGMGDVLTGFLTVFAAQGMPFYEAAALGSWLLGRGAELYHQATGWEEPGVALEIMRFAAGPAMAELRAGSRG